MTARGLKGLACVLCLGAGLMACGAPAEPPPVLSKQSPVALRAMQIRAFDTTSKRRMTRAVIAALQDLGYTVEKIDYSSGTISAAKLDALRMTVVIYPHGQNQTSVRANAIVRMPDRAASQVDDPGFYQKLFFEPLSKAVFLTALETEDDASAPPPPLPPAPPPAAKSGPKS
nr:hypothetical protein [uncultured Rhodopila sp.]